MSLISSHRMIVANCAYSPLYAFVCGGQMASVVEML